jgi:hypothetical protein
MQNEIMQYEPIQEGHQLERSERKQYPSYSVAENHPTMIYQERLQN